MEDHALERVPDGERESWLKITWNTVGLVTTLVIMFFGAVVCFVAGIKIVLNDGGVMTIEFPQLTCLIEGNQFDTIYQEHYCYFLLQTSTQECQN